MDGGVVVFHGSIETQYTWNFLKVLSLRQKMRDLWVLLTWFCLHFEHLANSDQLSYVGLHLVGLCYLVG